MDDLIVTALMRLTYLRSLILQYGVAGVGLLFISLFNEGASRSAFIAVAFFMFICVARNFVMAKRIRQLLQSMGYAAEKFGA